MPQSQFSNKELFGRLLKSTIGVVSRRTSDAYASVIIGGAIKDLSNEYRFLKYVNILNARYNEAYDTVEINEEINRVNVIDIGKASSAFIKRITKRMGKNAGYYFIKEIKEDLPTNHEKIIKEIGLDFDYLQTEFLTEMKETFMDTIQNYDIIKYCITIFYESLERKIGRDATYKVLNDFIMRLRTSNEALKFVKINDIRSIQGIDIVSVDQEINNLDSNIVGPAIQKTIQEINAHYENKGFSFIELLKEYLSTDYIYKLSEIGVNLDIIKLSQVLIFKNVLKALVEVLSEYSTKSYAVLIVNNALRKFDEKYVFIRNIKIDNIKFSGGADGIDIPDEINSVRTSDFGRALQKTIEHISVSLGEEAGKHFVEKFKKHLGKAYVLRIEEIGINLHMIELRSNLL